MTKKLNIKVLPSVGLGPALAPAVLNALLELDSTRRILDIDRKSMLQQSVSVMLQRGQ